MPSSESILAGLTNLANNWQWLAVVFHVYVAAFIILVLAGAALSKRLAGILLAIPTASVSVLAWLSRNPFNGALFAIIAIVLVVMAVRLPEGRVRIASLQVAIPGAVLLAFGWIYPHFLNTTSFFPYLYSAPMGIVPCPTLSAVIGMTLIFSSFERRGWGIFCASAGLLYGLFGALRLGVTLDWVLVAGAVALFVHVLLAREALVRKAAAK
jgi:hypothetical protein